MANLALDSLLAGLIAGLRAQIRPRIGLFDPLDDRPSPPDHYGHLCAALALACGGADDWAIGRQALQAWLALDAGRLGHLPFNRLALLLLRIVLAERGLDSADAAMIGTGLRRCRLRRRYPSNNWSLLTQTCRLIEAQGHSRASESRRLCALLKRWTTSKGAFIDFPARPGKYFATPLAYHHKALYLVALACWFHDDAELARHAHRLLDWLVHCWDPAGYAGGFGRTTHGLFGDGCLIAGMMLMGIGDDEWQQPIAALCRRLEAQRRADGMLWLTPAGARSGTASWDSYMHLSVYNAWAAAIIASARFLRDSRPPPTLLRDTRWTAARTGLFHDEEAGLAYLRTVDGLNAMLSTRGQTPQAYSRTEADFRYAGGVLLHLRCGDSTPLAAPPVRTTRYALAEAPMLAGWTPLLRAGEIIYALDRFDQIDIRSAPGSTTISLSGVAHEVFRPAPQTMWQRALATLDWRILGGRLGRRAALHRRVLRGLNAQVEINFSTPGLDITTRIDFNNRASSVIEYLNPCGHLAALPLYEHQAQGISMEGGAPVGPDPDHWRSCEPSSALPDLPARARAARALPHMLSSASFRLTGPITMVPDTPAPRRDGS